MGHPRPRRCVRATSAPLTPVRGGTLHIALPFLVYIEECELSLLNRRFCTHIGSSKAFNEAGARPGGFQCAPDEESAKNMYLELATNGMIAWASVDEQ